MTDNRFVVGFVRAYALPALWLFALPAFALWFSGHARDRFDADVLAAIERNVGADASLSAEERAQTLEDFRSVSASALCAASDEETHGFRQALGEACGDARQFVWMGRVALGALLVGLLSALVAGVCALLAFVSRPFQLGSFVVGWNVMRATSALQALAQGGLAVWLSFWVTALWMESYYPKLILAVGLLAGMAVLLVVQAIFRKPPDGFEVEGTAVPEARAPELWAHVRALCARLGTTPPDNLVTGIDDNFFVTEADVRVGDATLRGRTLFVSLPLLGLLERSEADAVLAHEMGHLLGGDTGHGKRLAPMLSRFDAYLGALHAGVLTRPIFYFMRAYRALFELSLGRSRRTAELAADRLAAGVTSGRDLARSLVKVGAYARYRGRVEEELFSRDEQAAEVAIPQRLSLGFAQYAASPLVHEDLGDAVTPHPFDSHPPLAVRLENVGEALEPDDVTRVLLEPAAASWRSAFLDADAIEAGMWAAYEARFAEAHDRALAFRYAPSTPAERAHVERHFPPLTFAGKKPGLEVVLDFEKMHCSEWEEPVAWSQVKAVSVNDAGFGLSKQLTLTLEGGGLRKPKRTLQVTRLQDDKGLLGALELYLGRHRASAEYQAQARAGRDAA